MKQKLINNILYVFSVEPYVITEDVDEATTIKVQQETYDGFIALNPDLADKIVKYNYHMLTVNKLEWADYVDEPDPEPTPEPELPEEGTVYDFTGYVDDSTSTPSSTGQVTYEGEYSKNTDYVYGTANVLFAGAGSAQEVTIYMTKTGLIDILDGGRAQVYTLQNDEMTSIGYGELSPIPNFETLNISQDQDHKLSASVQTDTDWTGKTVYASHENANIYLKMVPDGTDPTLLVLDTDYDGNVAGDTYLDEHPTGSVTVSNLVENRTYTCDYEWTNELTEPVKKYFINTYPALSVRFVGYVNGEVTWLDQAQIWENDVVGGNQLGQFAYYEAGTPFQIDANNCGIISATPELSLSEDRLWDLGPSYIMPNSDVELQLFEMPAADAQFEFNIFDSMESTESTASGTATWKGLYIGGIATDLSNGLYVTVRANGQFTGGTLIEEKPLFIQTVDVYPLISGERVEVRSLVEGTTETGVLGYIKFPGR